MPEIQVLIDATAMEPAGIGAGYISNILGTEITCFAVGADLVDRPAIDLVLRSVFIPNREKVLF